MYWKAPIYVILFLALPHVLKSQCLDYPAIDGATCYNCAPNGWEVTSMTPNLVVPMPIPCSNAIESPSGGTAIYMFGTPGFLEGVGTTISGLDICKEYYFSFWYLTEDCFGTEGSLRLTIDGVEHFLPIVFQWTLMEYCIFPSSSSILIDFLPQTNGSVVFLVDDAECKEDFCSGNFTPTFDFPLSYCENDDPFELPTTSLEGIDGTWDISPFDPSDYSDESVVVIFTADTNPLDCGTEIEIFVDGITTPRFSLPAEYCPNYIDYLTLPLISQNGIEGEWDRNDIFLEDFEGDVLDLTFTPLDPYCTASVVINITVLMMEELSFNLPNGYCQQDSLLFLDNFDQFGALGNWSLNPIDLSLPIDDYELTFIPDAELNIYCYDDYVYEYEIEESTKINFDIEALLCRSSKLIELDSFTLDSILGRWSVPRFRSDTISGDCLVSVWTSFSNDKCIPDTAITFKIQDQLVLDFDLPSLLCETDMTLVLPEWTTDNMVYGSWSLSTLDPQVLADQTFTSIFTPDDAFCAEPYSYMVEIDPLSISQFNLPSSICKTADPLILSNLSDNGISGQWTVNPIDPELIQTGSITSTFIADEDCSTPFELELSIVSNVVPEFDVVQYLCSDDAVVVLPPTSINGIDGSWTPATINPADYMDTEVTFLFTPEGVDCASAIDFTTWINGPISVVPETTDPTLCTSSDGTITLSSSQMNIEYSLDKSTWQTTPYNGLTAGSYLIFTRSISYPRCIDSLVVNLVAPSAPEIVSVEAPPILSCILLDGTITIDALGLNLEYSIDGGDTWQDNNKFEFLDDGVYEISVRTKNSPDCVTTTITSIIRAEPPIISSVFVSNVSDCNESDGGLTVTSLGVGVEYSIDSLLWQDEEEFTGLAEGIYTVYLRQRDNEDCITKELATIIAPTVPVIDQVIPTPPSSCGVDDGAIEILAQGNNLEYSFNNGMNWYTSNFEEDLIAGDYSVLVRDAESPNCVDSTTVTLFDPDLPIIDMIRVSDPTSCIAANGSIEILATGVDLEYSIDNGASWSSINFFDQLTDGNYDIQIREKSKPDCIAYGQESLEAVETVVITTVQKTDPSSCDPLTGTITIVAEGSSLEYSIDGGVSFQDHPLFEGLEANDYLIIIRDKTNTDCTDLADITLELIIEMLPQPFLDINQITDCNLADGSVIIGIDAINVSYSINDGEDWQTSDSFDNLGAGFYTVLIRSDLYEDCSNSIEFELEEPDCDCSLLDVEVIANPVYCIDISNGTIELEDISGYEESIIDISWTNGQSGTEIQNLESGWYYYLITYDDNCEWLDSVYVDEIDPLTFGLKSFDPDCEGNIEGVIEVVEVMGGNGGFNFSIDGTLYQDENIFYDLSPQEYLVHVLDEEECIETSLVTINEGLILELELPEIETIEAGDSIFLNPLINAATIDSFIWTPNVGILNPGELVAEVMPSATTEYTLQVFFGNCSELRNITIIVQGVDVEIYIPNIFSNDPASINNRFFIQGTESTEISLHHLYIYDRWGNKVFYQESPKLNDPQAGWNGEYNNQAVLPGVYVYYLDYSVGGESISTAGTISVIR